MDLTLILVMVVTPVSVLNAASFEYDPDYLVPSECTPCDAKSCPQLTYCAGVVVKDHCGCCNRCSSDLFQPHVRPSGNDAQPETSVIPESLPLPGNVCSKRKCPKFKVCVENMQGLPICTCPSEYICRRKGSRRNESNQEEVEICGTDGITYPSRCHLKIANCNSQKRIKKQHVGPCKANPSDSTSLSSGTDANADRLLSTTDVDGVDVQQNSDVQKINKARKKNKRKSKRKNRERRKQKPGRRQKKERREKKKRSKRMKRRHSERYSVYQNRYDDLFNKHSLWSKDQVRKSKI